ncbi:MAG: hypothetical protein U0176_23990 [Bacteroidia bacterium]
MKQKLLNPALGFFICLAFCCACSSDVVQDSKMDGIQVRSTAEVEEEKQPICPNYWSEDWPDSIPGPDQYVPVEKEPAPLNLSEVMAGIGYPTNGLGNGQVVLRILVDRQGRYNRHGRKKEPVTLVDTDCGFESS